MLVTMLHMYISTYPLLPPLSNLQGAAFDFLSSSFHYGAITGLDVCLRKPIVVSCSMDKTIRIWNYETKWDMTNRTTEGWTNYKCNNYFPFISSLELLKEFQEEAYSIAIHPSGLFLLVGFSEKLRLMNILIDDIRPFKEIMIRGCREVS